jgi:hypothetical protein
MKTNFVLTTLVHFGNYEIKVLSLSKEEGLSILRRTFEEEQSSRPETLRSIYSFEELEEGGDVHQIDIKLGESIWV